MDQTELKKIYWNNVETIKLIMDLLQAVRTQNEHKLSNRIPSVTRKMRICLEQIITNMSLFQEAGVTWDSAYLISVLSQIQNAQVDNDFILMGDLYELQMLPVLYDVQNAICGFGIDLEEAEWLEENLKVIREKDPSLWKKLEDFKTKLETNEIDGLQCFVEPTSTGAFTMAVQMGERRWYLHSNKDPIAEAKAYAQRAYLLEQEKYLLFGWGMGYHVRELLNLYNDMDLVVVEPNVEILYQALKYGDWTNILRQVTIVTECEQMPLNEGRELVLFRPELATLRNDKLREQLVNIANRKDSIEDFKNIFYQNTRANIINCDGYIDEIKEKIHGKKVVIVAGGPSLDKNLRWLKEHPKDVVVIAVGTVFKLLLRERIAIDFVVVSDGFIYSQIQGEEAQEIPMLILATADRRVAKNYQGPKYLVCQQGYEMAFKYAEKNRFMCYNSGGSVATLALDIAIRLQAASIAFIGLDLAYYGKQAHAAGTAQETFAGFQMRTVEGIDGTQLNTSQVFIQYREWMEHRITKEDVTMPIVDATEGGARKLGFMNMTLEEYLKG